MQINMRDLEGKLIVEFGYHDSKIIKVAKNKKDITILLKDGYEEQMDELVFVNAYINNEYDLEDRIIYQLEDLVYFEGSGWHMSFLIWTDDNLLEKVTVEAKNIISKKYQLKENVFGSETDYENKLNQLTQQLGGLTTETVRSDKFENLIEKIFHVKENEKILSDINNYILNSEEDLNEETQTK